MLPTLRGCAIFGARERISLLTRWDLALEMMAGNAFSIRIGSALSFALAPQIKISIIQSKQKAQVYMGGGTWSQVTWVMLCVDVTPIRLSGLFLEVGGMVLVIKGG